MYKRYSNLILVCALFITGCGFHLRGTSSSEYKFPFKSVYVDCNGIAICSNLKTAIKVNDLATLNNSSESASATIRFINDAVTRIPEGFNSAGRISVYKLTYQVIAQLWENNKQVGDDILVSSSADMQYNDSTILSNNQNENDFWNRLHEDAVHQLIYRVVKVSKHKELATLNPNF